MTDNAQNPDPPKPLPGPSNRTALLVWVIALILLFPAFAFLAKHPGWFLATEKRQPSRGLVRGSQLEKEGRYDDALSAFKGALNFYREQLAKTGSINHRMAVATAYHKMGLALLKRGDPGDRELAKRRFQQGVGVEPTVGRGEGQFLLGELEREQNPESALRRYAGVVAAVSNGLAIRALGRSAEVLTKLERWKEACRAYEGYIRFRSGEPDRDTSTAFAGVAERIGSTTGAALGRAYLQLRQTEKAEIAFQAAVSEDPVAAWCISQMKNLEPDRTGVIFNPRSAFVASVGIRSVSFTWPAGCVVEFISGKDSAGCNLVVTLEPDSLRPQPVQLLMSLNGEDAGQIEVSRGGPSDYQTRGLLRSGRNVLEIRCANTWFEPEDRPVITLLALKQRNRSTVK